ncbi:hypothetical protein E1B28_005054 [Marasmius oreades]|uniref:Uncharacterized protein n=1 Tax=Marasmius oreades TaxID=181124 RepID=A0A9P7UZT5_9AGAR|nr:uncharacterized protein E1B28_005054 [Marasmius oreades]KAG7097734.1 hypothetical protein E1B28_005054 [Marasmius oreades]
MFFPTSPIYAKNPSKSATTIMTTPSLSQERSHSHTRNHLGANACESRATTSFVADIPPSSIDDGYFAFAEIKDDICLVQVSSSTPITPLTTIDIKIFRHEFITIFRLLEATTLHPGDVRILETIDDRLKCYEEEKETVYLAKEVVERMRKLSFHSLPHPGQFRPRTRIARTLPISRGCALR